MEKVTSDLILDTLLVLVESKKIIPREEWINIAFKLNLLRIDEAKLLNGMKQAVAQKKLDIYKTQDKKNVSGADLEIEASESYKFMRDQEAKIEAIDQFVMIAKKAGDY